MSILSLFTLLIKSKSSLKVVIKVLVKKLLSILEELIILISLFIISLIHKPFLFITAKWSLSVEY
jgi:hypothetical protein